MQNAEGQGRLVLFRSPLTVQLKKSPQWRQVENEGMERNQLYISGEGLFEKIDAIKLQLETKLEVIVEDIMYGSEPDVVMVTLDEYIGECSSHISTNCTCSLACF